MSVTGLTVTCVPSSFPSTTIVGPARGAVNEVGAA
jgi:hypothetical protein